MTLASSVALVSPAGAVTVAGQPVVFASPAYNLANPVGFALDGSHLWVATSANVVQELSATDGSLIAEFNDPSYGFAQPSAIAVAGGTVWVVNESNNTVTRLNAADGSLKSIIADASFGFNTPLGIATDGTSVWVSNFHGNSVTQINAADGALIRVAGAGLSLSGPGAITTDGTTVFVANYTTSTVTAFKGSDASLVATVSTSSGAFSHPDGLALANGQLFVANYSSNTISELNATTLATTATGLASGHLSGPTSLATIGSGSASTILVTNRVGNSVTQLNAAGTFLQNFSGVPTGLNAPVASISFGSTLWIANSAGSSLTNLTIPSVTPSPVPASLLSPTAVVATPANSSATVTWSAPVGSGGQLITKYTVTSSSAKTCTTSVGSAGGRDRTCVVSGLANGTPVTFTVTATTSAGTSQASSASTPITPATTPSAPTGVTAKAGDATVTVSWTTPASGGSPITSYLVSDGKKTCTATAPQTTCDVTGLSDGLSYSFVVTATNAFGTGPASAASQSVMPAKVPSAPTGASGTSGNGAITASWLTSPDNGGSAILHYTATANGGTGTHQCTVTVQAVETDTCVISGLTNGTAYTVTVTATNAIGTSAPSTPSSSVTPVGPPGAPTGVTATPLGGGLSVDWTAPSSDGGSAITFYSVSDGKGHGCQTTDGATLFCQVVGVTAGVPYVFSVIAHNSFGQGIPATVNGEVPGAPSVPTHVVATTADGSTTVSWQAPANDGGSPITGYVVNDFGGDTCTKVTPSSCTFVGLTNGATYTFEVWATNAVSDGTPATIEVIPSVVPTAPTGLVVKAANASVTVSFATVLGEASGGAPVTSYVATVVGAPSKHCQVGATPNGRAQCVIKNLTNFAAVSVMVVAMNPAGTSATSARSAVVVPFIPLLCAQVPSSAVLSPANKALIAKLTSVIANDGIKRVTLDGYSDTSLTPAKALAYSRAIALAVEVQVKKNLKSAHLAVPVFVIVGHGSAAPVSANKTAVGRALNRRVLVTLR